MEHFKLELQIRKPTHIYIYIWLCVQICGCFHLSMVSFLYEGKQQWYEIIIISYRIYPINNIITTDDTIIIIVMISVISIYNNTCTSNDTIICNINDMCIVIAECWMHDSINFISIDTHFQRFCWNTEFWSELSVIYLLPWLPSKPQNNIIVILLR